MNQPTKEQADFGWLDHWLGIEIVCWWVVRQLHLCLGLYLTACACAVAHVRLCLCICVLVHCAVASVCLCLCVCLCSCICPPVLVLMHLCACALCSCICVHAHHFLALVFTATPFSNPYHQSVKCDCCTISILSQYLASFSDKLHNIQACLMSRNQDRFHENVVENIYEDAVFAIVGNVQFCNMLKKFGEVMIQF